MPQVVARIVEKAEPQFGKKRGRIKDSSGLIYQIAPALAQMVQVGGTYDLIYKDDEFNGNKFRVIESLTTAGMAAPPMPVPPPAPQAQSYQPPYQPSQSSDLSQMHKEELIAGEALLKCCQPIAVGDTQTIAHGLKSCIMAYRMVRHWQKSGNIESGPQSYDDITDFR